MRGISIAKALFIPLVVMLGTAGVVLMFIGGIELWKISGDDVNRDQVYKQLQPYVSCDYVATLYSNTSGPSGASNQNQTTDFKNAITNYCHAKQRPYIWFVSITATMMGITVLLSLCTGWKLPRAWLFWLAVHNAVTIALLLTLVYVYMQGTVQAATLQDCTGFDSATMDAIQSTGLKCWRGQGMQEMRSAARIFKTLLPCLWIGIAFSLFALFIFNILLAAVWHSKGREEYVGGAGSYPGSYAAGAGPGPGPSFYSEPPRRPTGVTP